MLMRNFAVILSLCFLLAGCTASQEPVTKSSPATSTRSDEFSKVAEEFFKEPREAPANQAATVFLEQCSVNTERSTLTVSGVVRSNGVYPIPGPTVFVMLYDPSDKSVVCYGTYPLGGKMEPSTNQDFSLKIPITRKYEKQEVYLRVYNGARERVRTEIKK